MLLKMFIPLIAFILLQNIREFDQLTKALRIDFESSYHTVRCARQDVYERNIEDGVLYLEDRFSDLVAKADEFVSGEDTECDNAEFAVYRETNEDLELLHPNWTFVETLLKGDDG
ncbi:MAG: hypothetical protein EOP10_05540 [Proteobacteria bacterium]|nr:MAG: hypothetical protein EOP10_05540 [Pseudomonadota bacterium]